MLKNNNFITSIQEFYKNFTHSLTKIYLSTFILFLIGFTVIFMSPIFSGGSYAYDNTKLNEYEMVNNNIQIALVRKEYNPDKELMRLDFSLKETSDRSSLANIKYNITSRYIKDKGNLKVDTIKVNDDYIVALIKGIPEGFSVLSTTIMPSYEHPEIEENNDLENRSIKTYVNETENIVNKKLETKTKKDYQLEYISFQQDSIKEKIDTNKDEIASTELTIQEIKNMIHTLEDDIKYQTEEEKLDSKSEINSHLSSMKQHETEIDTLKEDNENLLKKIDLLEEKKKAY